MKRRLILVLVVAVVWSMATPIWGLALGWMLLGAAAIGIIGTIGLNPPRRRSFAHLLRRCTMLRSVRTKG